MNMELAYYMDGALYTIFLLEPLMREFGFLPTLSAVASKVARIQGIRFLVTFHSRIRSDARAVQYRCSQLDVAGSLEVHWRVSIYEEIGFVTTDE
ncbi:unnamed protein product [Mycena citricolor]|uniref:Uncharacterized protein n=1 Tax=Mycena citricolor TaxID=2018698 RepID=A0AAD2JXB9_9AGAR|nr:unnamed protein product [Mycena citricolor]